MGHHKKVSEQQALGNVSDTFWKNADRTFLLHTHTSHFTITHNQKTAGFSSNGNIGHDQLCMMASPLVDVFQTVMEGQPRCQTHPWHVQS